MAAMARKKRYSCRAVLPFLSLTILQGCQSPLDVTLNEAQEVALDDAGFTPSDVKNLKTDQTDSGFIVDFEADDHALRYFISTEGTIQSRKSQKSAAASSEYGNHSAPSASDSAAASNSAAALNSASASGSASSASINPVNPSQVNQEAVNIALASQQLQESQVTNLQTAEEGNRVTVTFQANNQHYSVVIDLALGQPIASSIQ